MFNLDKRDGPKPKCFFTSSRLPAFIDHEQISTKKKPFSTISAQTFTHTLELLLPNNNAKILQAAFKASPQKLQYAKVYMKLSEVIEGDFFNQFIKPGNIIMLSEGRPGIDHIFSLSNGVLRLEVDKPTYERMGLQGSPMPSEGRKHVKARYAVELNLRLPSMVRGKKGFERIIRAFKNVLSYSVTWLFCNVNGPTDGTGPIVEHQPQIKTVNPEVVIIHDAIVPGFPEEMPQKDYESAAELLEWLGLAASTSPRIQSNDNIDPYLSRYQVPDHFNTETQNVQDLAVLRWHGFLPSKSVQDIFLGALKTAGEDWFAITATAFDRKAYTFLQNKHHTLTWEYMD